MTTALHVGMVGVGLMGHGIAYNLAKKGFRLHLYAHPGNRPLDELTANGAQVYTQFSELTSRANVIILCVTGAPEVEAVLAGDGGLVNSLRPGTCVIDCSTSLPETTLRMAQIVEAKGGKFLDAPMTRLAKEAREGRLNLLVGGDLGVLQAVRPVLAAFAENITHVGPIGAGHRMKLMHNFVSLGFMTLLAEAAAHARFAGIDAATFVQVLEKGGGAGAALQRLGPAILEGNTQTVPFFVGNALKDLRYYLEMSATANVHQEVAQAVADSLQARSDAGHGQAFMSELVDLLST